MWPQKPKAQDLSSISFFCHDQPGFKELTCLLSLATYIYCWAVRVPIEIRMPEDLEGAAREFFKGRRPGPYSHIALASVIRHNFSNYDELIFQLEYKSLRCNSHPKEVMAAHQTLRERFDRQICKLLRQMPVRPGLKRRPGEARELKR